MNPRTLVGTPDPAWTQRNEDKPHRCPCCHGIAERARSWNGYGPRTVMRCPTSCAVQWRAGSRAGRYSMAFKRDLRRLRAAS